MAAAIEIHLAKHVQVDGIFTVGLGSNEDTHYVATITDGDKIGLKGITRMANGPENERLVSLLADLLEAPGHQRYGYCPKGSLSFRADLDFVLMPWLRGGVVLDDLVEHELNSLREAPESFCEQAGQWIAFCLLFSVQDRHAQNWLWSGQGGTLLAIDAEESFGVEVYPNELRSLYSVTGLYARLETARAATERGLRRMLAKYRTRSIEIQHALQHVSHCVGYANPYSAISEDEFVDWVIRELMLR